MHNDALWAGLFEKSKKLDGQRVRKLPDRIRLSMVILFPAKPFCVGPQLRDIETLPPQDRDAGRFPGHCRLKPGGRNGTPTKTEVPDCSAKNRPRSLCGLSNNAALNHLLSTGIHALAERGAASITCYHVAPRIRSLFFPARYEL